MTPNFAPFDPRPPTKIGGGIGKVFESSLYDQTPGIPLTTVLCAAAASYMHVLIKKERKFISVHLGLPGILYWAAQKVQ